jgi:hypothetical protein
MMIIVGDTRLLLALGIAVVGAVVLAACDGGGTTDTPSPADTEAPTATATAAPSPTPSPPPVPTPSPSPTPEPVLSACEAVPALPTTVSDQANLYSISVPVDWAVVTDEGAMGLQVSRIVMESPDFSVFVDEAVEGPHSNIYYQTGAILDIHVGTIAPGPPHPFGGVISESDITIDGVTAPYHVFKEPSTSAGQLLDAHVDYGGNHYIFRLGYNPETCPAGEDLFQAMLDSFQFQ